MFSYLRMSWFPLLCASVVVPVLLVHGQTGPKQPDIELVYEWNTIEYEWPNASMKHEYTENGLYNATRSAINGIKVFNNTVYVTVPRLKDGVPSTLNVVVKNPNTSVTSPSHILRPFPSWEMQLSGNCDALQLVQSMEIDPNTGMMWILDTGFVPTRPGVTIRPFDSCPAKLIVYDLVNNREVSRYNFPKETVGYGMFYLNDIVLMYDNGTARWAFISDTLDYKLVVYDHLEKRSYYYSHPSMAAIDEYKNITISNETLTVRTGINGIAMSADFRYVYYSAVAGIGLHQIPTSVLTTAEGSTAAFAANVRTVGEKVSPGDGMAYGAKDNLYYSALEMNAVYKWNLKEDVTSGDFGNIDLKSHSELVSENRMEWVDTLALDEEGYLWFTTSRLHQFFSVDGITDAEPNFYVWKVFVDDYHYLNATWQDRDQPTLAAASSRVSYLIVFACVCIAALLA